MNNYQLIAFDMDGTLLNSDKQISPETLNAIKRAGDAGKTVILCTGRNLAELNAFTEIIPGLRYLDCVSGACVYHRIPAITIRILLPSRSSSGLLLPWELQSRKQ